jgi:hypothetical protein
MTPEELDAVHVNDLRDALLRRGDFVLLAILSVQPAGGLQELVWAHKGTRYTLIGLTVDLQERLLAALRADSL